MENNDGTKHVLRPTSHIVFCQNVAKAQRKLVRFKKVASKSGGSVNLEGF